MYIHMYVFICLVWFLLQLRASFLGREAFGLKKMSANAFLIPLWLACTQLGF